jgi:hypothetical protein
MTFERKGIRAHNRQLPNALSFDLLFGLEQLLHIIARYCKREQLISHFLKSLSTTVAYRSTGVIVSRA